MTKKQKLKKLLEKYTIYYFDFSDKNHGEKIKKSEKFKNNLSIVSLVSICEIYSISEDDYNSFINDSYDAGYDFICFHKALKVFYFKKRIEKCFICGKCKHSKGSKNEN